MRIGMITGEYPPMQGGVGDYTRELALALAARGHELHVLTSQASASGQFGPVQVDAVVGQWNLAPFTVVRQWAADRQLELVNIQYEAAAFKMAAAVHLLPTVLHPFPTVTTFHDLLVPYLFPKAGRLRTAAITSLARTSHAVIVTNAQDEAELRGRIAPLYTIPIGSNIADAPPQGYDRLRWRYSLDVPDDAFVVGYFGFLHISKGIDTLLEGVARAMRNNLNVYMLMIGGEISSSDPTQANNARLVNNIIEQLHLRDRIRWTGYVTPEQVSASLHACDVVALPYKDGVSYRRGSFMAAIAHGCAVATTRPAVELPDLMNWENVVLFPPDSSADLSEALIFLAEDPALRERLGMGARALSRLFGWDHIAAQVAAVYEQIVRARR